MIEHKCSNCGHVCDGAFFVGEPAFKGGGPPWARIVLPPREYKAPEWKGEIFWGPLVTTVNCEGAD